MMKIEVTGKQLQDILEHAVGQVGRSYGRFPQVSGLTLQVRASEEPGPRVSDVQIGGRPLDLTARYTMTTNSFLWSGGDGFNFAGAKVLLAAANAPLLNNLIFARLEREPSIAPKIEGRIRKGAVRSRPPAQRVIVDLDPSIDSVLALMLLLRTPDVRVDAVTVVEGMSSVADGGRNAVRILDLAGAADIPVHLGESGVPVGGFAFPDFWKKESAGLGGARLAEPSRPPHTKPAAQAIVDLLNAFPNEITVVALGPLTNVGAALAKDPTICAKAKQIVAMGGALRARGNVDKPFVGFHNSVAEWNFFADSRAAETVVASCDSVVLVALDAVREAPVTPKFLARLAAAPAGSLNRLALALLKSTEETIRDGTFYFWDAIAAAAAVNPALVSCAETKIKVHTAPTSHAGWIEVVAGVKGVAEKGHAVDVCTHADRQAFEDYFMRMLSP